MHPLVFMANSYDSIISSVERVLSNHKNVMHERETVCPDCLESYPVNNATVFEWKQVLECKQGVLKCKKGHKVGISKYS